VADELQDPGPYKNANAEGEALLPHGDHHTQNECRTRQHGDEKNPGEPGVINHARREEDTSQQWVGCVHQSHQAQHDQRNGDEVDQLVGRVLVALAVMGQQLIDAAYVGSGVLGGSGHLCLLRVIAILAPRARCYIAAHDQPAPPPTAVHSTAP
jgi:hypothetical protein